MVCFSEVRCRCMPLHYLSILGAAMKCKAKSMFRSRMGSAVTSGPRSIMGHGKVGVGRSESDTLLREFYISARIKCSSNVEAVSCVSAMSRIPSNPVVSISKLFPLEAGNFHNTMMLQLLDDSLEDLDIASAARKTDLQQMNPCFRQHAGRRSHHG